MPIQSAAAAGALFSLDCHFACLERRKKMLRGKSRGEHPIRPTGE